MSDAWSTDRVNEFFREKAPGLHGVVFDTYEDGVIVGHIDVTDALIAGNGFLFAPAIISLADTLCAGGFGAYRPDGAAGFTTLELKANFLGTARAGERVVGSATPSHLGRTTQVWDCVVTNETTAKTIALFRCTQMVLYPR